MGGYRPVPLDQLPIPQAAEPTQFKPAPIDQPPTPQPAGAGYMKTGGQIADVASNFLTGWLKGKQQAEQKKLAVAQQNMEGLHYGFQIAQQNAAQIAQDPNATPDAKAKAEQARQAAWKAYLDGAEQYTTPPKGQKSGGGGGKGGQDGGMKAKLKQTFGAEDPHIFSQGAMALLRTTGPPALPQPNPQDEEARIRMDREKKIYAAQDAITEARKTNDPKKIEAAETAYRDISGQIETKGQKFEDSLVDAQQSFMAGKEVNEQTKQILEARGYIPKPVGPDLFQRQAPNGDLYIDAIDKQTGKIIKSSYEGKGRVSPSAREDAWAMEQGRIKMMRKLATPGIQAQHPDWNQQQINTALDSMTLQWMETGDFKQKMGGSSNLSQVDSRKEMSQALDQIHANLDPDDQAKWDAVITQGYGAAGGWMFKDQVAPASWWQKWAHGASDEGTRQYKEDIIAQTREILTKNLKLSKPKFTDEQIQDTVDEMMGGPGMGATPEQAGGGGTPASPYDPAGIR